MAGEKSDPFTEEFFKAQSEAYQKVRVFLKKKTPEETAAAAVATTTEEGGGTSALEEAKQACETSLKEVEAVSSTLTEEHPFYYRLLAMRSALMYERARFDLNTSNMEVANRMLTAALELIIDRATKPEISFLVLRVINHFAYNLATRDALDTALVLLEKGEKIYVMVRTIHIADETIPGTYYTSDDLFAPSTTMESRPETASRLERLVTNNFQMMTYIYSRTDREELFQTYQNRVLNRQLQMREGEALGWAGKTSRVAHAFLQKLQFKNARTHLAAASDILHEYNTDLKKMAPGECTPQTLQQMNYQVAEVGRLWVKYALTLFSASKHQLIERIFNETQQCEFFEDTPCPKDKDSQQCLVCGAHEPEKAAAEEKHKPPPEFKGETQEEKKVNAQEIFPVSIEAEDLNLPESENQGKKAAEKEKTAEGEKDQDEKAKELNQKNSAKNPASECYNFPTLDLKYIESRVQADYVTNTKEARQVFMFTQPWLKRTMSYYNLGDFPAEYVNCILDQSELYRYLAFFEEDMEAQYNVQKRRADTLETLASVLHEGNPACYMGASVELYRELAEVQIEMLGLNLRRLYASDCNPEAMDEGAVANVQMSDRIEWEVHKLEAIKDIHGRLEEFKSYLAEAEGQENEEEEMEMPTEEGLECVPTLATEAGDVTLNVAEKDTTESVCIDTDSSGDASTVCRLPIKDDQKVEVEPTVV